MGFSRIISPGLGGKLGTDVAERFSLEYFGALSEIPLSTLTEEYGDKTGYVIGLTTDFIYYAYLPMFQTLAFWSLSW